MRLQIENGVVSPNHQLWRRGRELNPRIPVLQTSALPLCYLAVCLVGLWRVKFMRGWAPVKCLHELSAILGATVRGRDNRAVVIPSSQ